MGSCGWCEVNQCILEIQSSLNFHFYSLSLSPHYSELIAHTIIMEESEKCFLRHQLHFGDSVWSKLNGWLLTKVTVSFQNTKGAGTAYFSFHRKSWFFTFHIYNLIFEEAMSFLIVKSQFLWGVLKMTTFLSWIEMWKTNFCDGN